MELTDMQIHGISGNKEGFTQGQLDMLDAPLDANLIKQRPDKKLYLKGSTEFESANRIFGYGKWGYRVIGRTLQKVYDLDDKVVGLYFYVEVELYVAGAMFPFYGDGGQGVKYYTPQGYEDAAKGATTDAVKRALRHYGNAFGLPLYDEDAMVDAGDGVMVKVKEVKVNNNQQPQKRIVDAKNAPKQIAQPDATQPTSTVNAPSPSVLQKRSDELLGKGWWEHVKAFVMSEAVPDDNLTPENCKAIHDVLEQTCTGEQQASIRKLCQYLNAPEPKDLASVKYLVAKKLIQDLSAEYREKKAQQKQQDKAS